MTDGAATYPASLAAVWPGVPHEAGKRIRQPIARGHQHPKCRPRPIRGFKTLAGARVPCRAHAFLRNLQGQFYDLGRSGCAVTTSPLPPLVQARDALTVGLLGN